MYQDIRNEILSRADPERAKASSWFFKTGPGEYGEGDEFCGVKMPEIRVVAKKFFRKITIADLEKLVYDPIHEIRMCGWLLLLYNYEKTRDEQLIKFLQEHKAQLNNWDFVDVIVPKTFGQYLLDKDRSILYKYAKSKHLWTRRISVLATFAFFRSGELDDSYKICEMLLNDKHDLMHKAVGWCLRECGKRDEERLCKFLDRHIKVMPRTMVRYAIEKFEEKKRLEYLRK